MMFFKAAKKRCTAETSGTIVKCRWDGDVWFLTVKYVVDGKTYRLKEQLTYHVNSTYKLGKIPIGIHSSCSIENISEGEIVRVKYNPYKPKQGFLPDNNGKYII